MWFRVPTKCRHYGEEKKKESQPAFDARQRTVQGGAIRFVWCSYNQNRFENCFKIVSPGHLAPWFDAAMQAVWTPIDFFWTYLELQLTAASTSTITFPIFEILLWFPPLLRLSNRATECTCHVRVLWLWWWLCSAPRALVCISWQMGFSAPLALPVMMSHVPVYQTGHTQLSPHLLLSQSPIPLPSVFIFLPLRHVRLPLPTCHTHAVSLSSGLSLRYPRPHRSVSDFTFKLNHQVYVCSRQMQLWQLCRALRGSQVCADNTVRCVNYRPLLMQRANFWPLR